MRVLLAAALLLGGVGACWADPKPKPAPQPAPAAARIERLQLDRAQIGEAFRLLAELTKRNLIVTPEAAKVEVDSLLLEDIPLKDAVEAICKTYGLWYREEGRVLRVMTAAEYRRDLRVVREPKTQVFSLLHPNPVAVAGAIRDLYGQRVRLSLGTDERDLVSNRGGIGSGSTSLRGSGRGNFASQSGGRRGGSTPTSTLGGGSEDPAAEELREEGVSPAELARLSDPDGQIRADLRGLTRGKPSIAVTVNRRHNLLVVRTADEDALREIGKLIADLDRPTPQVLLEMKILEVRLSDGFRSVLDVDWADGPVRNDLATNKGANPFLAGATSALEQIAGGGNFPLTAGTVVYQFLDEHVRVRLQMLASEERLSVLATPMVLCANNEVSRLFVGEERPLVRNFELQTTVTNGVVQTQVIPTVDLRDVGTTLRVLPRINADRTVTLTILQDVSSISPGGATLPVASPNGGIQSFPIDTVRTSNMEGTVVARDGMTLAVGGLIRKEHVDRRVGIPYLMDLPLIGWLFGDTERGEERRELILLITPHVLLTPEEGRARSAARMRALSLHPFHDTGDKALNAYGTEDVPGSSDYRLLVEDYLIPATEPIR
ncbi:MAG: type II secretion system protein GspD [Planctomycetes bacterium]|nr:type II secretion system protein GspD [Planctomycetota bacterium]